MTTYKSTAAADRLRAQADQLLAEAARISQLPDPPVEPDGAEDINVVFFKRLIYSYAAIKANGRWYVTQGRATFHPMSWDELVKFADGEIWAATQWEVL